MDQTGNEPKQCESNVDEQVHATSSFHENAQWWQDDGQNDFANVGTLQRHAVVWMNKNKV